MHNCHINNQIVAIKEENAYSNLVLQESFSMYKRVYQMFPFKSSHTNSTDTTYQSF